MADDSNPEYNHQYTPGQQYHYQQQMQHQQQVQHPMHQIPRDDSFIKLKRLDEINNSIVRIINSLLTFFDDLSKDKQPPTKLKVTKQMFEDFIKLLKKFETDLLTEITNLTLASTGHPHEGSIYGAKKDYDLARMRLNLICARLGNLRQSLDAPLKQPDEDDEDENTQNEKNEDSSSESERPEKMKLNGFH